MIIVKINSEFFSLCFGITCCWGALKPGLHLGRVLPNSVHVCYTLFREILFRVHSHSLNFFFRNVVSAILTVLIELECFF